MATDTRTGHQVIEDALKKAAEGNWLASPAGCGPEEGRAYQRGLAAAYQHALEMIPAALVAPQVEQQPAPQASRVWRGGGTLTVADLVNNLLTLDQELPVYGAQYIERRGQRRAIAVHPTVSRERVADERWIGEGQALNAAVIWTRAEQPALEKSLAP